jgi:hypothetical protein
MSSMTHALREAELDPLNVVEDSTGELLADRLWLPKNDEAPL